METTTTTCNVATGPEGEGVGDAVGVQAAHWYVAIVKHNTEKAVAEKLLTLGYDPFVAKQQEYRVWRNGRRKKIDRIVIPSTVFIHCTEAERLQVVNQPFIYRFLTNKASTPNMYGKPVAIIPDSQMSVLQFMLGASDTPVSFADRHFTPGQAVRVIRGSLRGISGTVTSAPDGKSTLTIRLDNLGCASVTIDTTDLEPLSQY